MKRIDGPHEQLEYCLSPDHKPPTHLMYEPGRYVHECPSCHHKSYFIVARVQAVA